MSTLQIETIPQLDDNYAYLVTETTTQQRALVDPSEPGPIFKQLKDRELHYILNTHHHLDHVGGNLDVKAKTGAQVVGNKLDASRIPGIDCPLEPGESFLLGNQKAQIIGAKGHTNGHILFWFEDMKTIFTGDTLFSMGCGRLFEGSPKQMWDSLKRFLKMPPDTRIYCGHEYAKKNARFARQVDPENQVLKSREKEVLELRQQGLPTVPVLLETELATNPFLRAENERLQKSLGTPVGDAVAAFAELRRRRDQF